MMSVLWDSALDILHTERTQGELGIYACSPENSSFKATFTNMELTECKWLTHDGQAPDEKQKFQFFEIKKEVAKHKEVRYEQFKQQTQIR